MIYFIHNRSERAVKVGYSADPFNRIGDLQTGSVSRLFLIGAIDGGRTIEARWHAALSTARIAGEWFRDDVVLASINRMLGRLYVCLFEFDDDGNRVNYYKRADELTVVEAGKHLDNLNAIVEKDERILKSYLDFYSNKFGDEIQGQFGFDLT